GDQGHPGRYQRRVQAVYHNPRARRARLRQVNSAQGTGGAAQARRRAHEDWQRHVQWGHQGVWKVFSADRHLPTMTVHETLKFAFDSMA
ncbi:unnamed protein product, partial [Ectocarpus sp. 12 AP-2014]